MIPIKTPSPGLINPGRTFSPFATPHIPLAYPLAKFIPSVSDKNYRIIVKVLPYYVFEKPEYGFLRITIYFDGQKRVVRTVLAQQIAYNTSGRPYTIAVHGHREGRSFYWKSIMIGMDEDAEPQPHDEWNYDLGSMQVYIYYMRAEEGAESGEDSGDSDKFVDKYEEEEIGSALGTPDVWRARKANMKKKLRKMKMRWRTSGAMRATKATTTRSRRSRI